MTEEGSEVADIERDLMLGYTRQFYEILTEREEKNSPKSITPTEKIIVPPPVVVPDLYQPPRIIVVPDMDEEEYQMPTKTAEPTPQAAETPTEAMEILPLAAAEVPTQPSEILPTVVAEMPKEPLRWQSPRDIQEAENHLFDEAEISNDPSERFAFNTRIENLHGAMSINDRVSTLNDLFNGDHVVFKETLDALNEMADFEQAKERLKKMAFRYDWASAAKESKSKNFIKTVRRKFL